MRTLIADVRTEIGDLTALESIDGGHGVGPRHQAVQGRRYSQVRGGDIVRSDLGLPQSPV